MNVVRMAGAEFGVAMPGALYDAGGGSATGIRVAMLTGNALQRAGAALAWARGRHRHAGRRAEADRIRYGRPPTLADDRTDGVFSVIQPTQVFKDNLAQLPAIDGIARIDLVGANGDVVATIENQPGKQGSLAVYHYLKQAFGTLDAKAAEHGLAVFAEHTADARNRPGAHPNVDRLLAIAAGGDALRIDVVANG